MVKIAIAGGSGNVAQEIIDVLAAQKKHEILLLSRKDAPANTTESTVTWVKADYQDPAQLIRVLQGVHTVLSLIAVNDETGSTIQKNLIDAAIQAGVKRFAPSEWSTAKLEQLAWYAYKIKTRNYLKEINKDKKVLEYTLFQPGLLLNYFTGPHKSSIHVHAMEMPIDFNSCRAIVLDGSDNDQISLITVQDLAHIVARAIDFEGEWPVIGGITGAKVSVAHLIALGEKLRDTPFKVEKVKAEEIERGDWETSWIPRLDHPSIPPEQVDAASRMIVAGLLIAISAQAYSCSDEWNKLLPDYKFSQPEEFLSKYWRGQA